MQRIQRILADLLIEVIIPASIVAGFIGVHVWYFLCR